MQVTSATQTQYIPTTSKTNTEQEIHNPFKGQDYVLKTLDDEGNELLNNALVGKTDEEKWMIKLGLDMELSTEVKDGTLENKTTIDNSKENAMSMLDAFIQRRKELATPDMIGVGAIAEKLLEAYKASNSSFNIQNTEDSVVDSFLDDLYSSGSTATASAITKDTIKNKVNEYAQTLMENRDDTSESKLEVSKILNDYKKELINEYKESLEGSKNGAITLQQEAIIKVLLDENTQEASSLEKLLSGTDTITKTQATGRMSEMEEKYKDVYTPIPETYSKADEELQTQKIYEAHPKYLQPGEFLALVDAALQGEPIKLGQKLTKEEEAIQKLDYEQAYEKAYAVVGGEEAYIAMMKNVKLIQNDYPVNTLGKNPDIHNSRELTRFTNAAVYEGLEQGKTLEEAKISAARSMTLSMDTSYIRENFMDMIDKSGLHGTGKSTYEPEAIEYNAHTPIWDLREYGIEGLGSGQILIIFLMP